MDATRISTAVHDKYSSIARTSLRANTTSTENQCCKNEPGYDNENANVSKTDTSKADDDYATRVASSFGYSAEALASLPPTTNLGLSCGNPLALTTIHPSETVIDLGSGGGLDVLLAAKAMLAHPSLQNSASLLPEGHLYGIDSSQDMISLSRRNLSNAKDIPSSFRSKIQFIHSPITSISLPSNSTDLIISNCVLNLLPHEQKPEVFKEIYRLLKPGGRLAVSDILVREGKEMPDHIRKNVALMVGCVAGAAKVEEYRKWMREAGFEDNDEVADAAGRGEQERGPKILFRATGADLNAYKQTSSQDGSKGNQSGCCGGSAGAGDGENGELFDVADDALNDLDFNEWVASYEIYAVK